jgi:cellulose synthase/poly-beta-1,6-N-acetylglucosamine synthase-like glycosyltransferase
MRPRLTTLSRCILIEPRTTDRVVDDHLSRCILIQPRTTDRVVDDHLSRCILIEPRTTDRVVDDHLSRCICIEPRAIEYVVIRTRWISSFYLAFVRVSLLLFMPRASCLCTVINAVYSSCSFWLLFTVLRCVGYSSDVSVVSLAFAYSYVAFLCDFTHVEQLWSQATQAYWNIIVHG